MLASSLRFFAVSRDTQGKSRRFVQILEQIRPFPVCLQSPCREQPPWHKAYCRALLLSESFAPTRKLTLLPKVSRPLCFGNFGQMRTSWASFLHHRPLSSPLVSRSCAQFSSVQMLKPSLSSISAKIPFAKTAGWGSALEYCQTQIMLHGNVESPPCPKLEGVAHIRAVLRNNSGPLSFAWDTRSGKLSQNFRADRKAQASFLQGNNSFYGIVSAVVAAFFASQTGRDKDQGPLPPLNAAPDTGLYHSLLPGFQAPTRGS